MSTDHLLDTAWPAKKLELFQPFTSCLVILRLCIWEILH